MPVEIRWSDSGFAGIWHATVWGSGGSHLDLNPSGLRNSYIHSTNGSQQVGAGNNNVNETGNHALLWNGTAASVVDLNPSGFTSSYAYHTDGVHQVGIGAAPSTGGNNHAMLWSGTNVAVDLNPTNISGITTSQALSLSGSQQVGSGSGTATGGNDHAMLWSSSANSAVDLHPSNLSLVSSQATGIGGAQQVGSGLDSGGSPHALLWSGSNVAVDLTPASFAFGVANGTNGIQQVGVAYSAGDQKDHAIVWTGTAASAVDLSTALTGNYAYTEALWIDASGDVFGFGELDNTFGYQYIEWKPLQSVPEPLIAPISAMAILFMRRHRHR